MRREAFTMIEVLVALLVGSLTMAAVAHSAWSLVAGERRSALEQAAAAIAEQALEERLSRGAAALAAEESSDWVDDPLGPFERRIVVEPGERENLWHLVVTATPARGGAPVSLHTLLRRPWMVP
jgi:prepilin-type N-terminal cleavage/methylation domain-containing protein